MVKSARPRYARRTMIRLYAFLGNYGREYSGTRHNVAWQFLASLRISAGLPWKRGFKGSWAAVETGGGKVFFLKPETYMNLSGDSVAELSRFHKIEPADILAVHDELEIGFGYFGLKMGGGLGGHNGLRSMRERLGTADFARLRFGIGRPSHDDIAGYVLSDFSGSEREALGAAVFPRAEAVLEKCIAEGFEAAFQGNAKVNALA